MTNILTQFKASIDPANNSTATLPSPHYLPNRQDQLNYLYVKPSEMPGSFFGTNLYPFPAFMAGICAGWLAFSFLFLIISVVLV